MMETKQCAFTLRIDCCLLRKLDYIAQYEGRSKNREMKHFIKKYIIEFEEKHGVIHIETDSFDSL